MTKTKLLGIVLGVVLFLTPVQATAEQVYAKSAPTATVQTVEAKAHTPAKEHKPKPAKVAPCNNFLVEVLWEAGFRKENLREAWSISMRESGGNARSISATNDYGLFQFNYAAWHRQRWWNSSKLLTRDYNAKIAFEISRGGRTWYPWDIDGHGNHKGRYTSQGTYQKYKHWYSKYPAQCKK